jgi:hypothetical protein
MREGENPVGGTAYGVLSVRGGEHGLSFTLLYELRVLQVVTDDTDPDDLEDLCHGSRVLSDAYQ